jgi:hypothetical protein
MCEDRRRSQVREALEGVHQLQLTLDLGAALRALCNVRLKRSHAEPFLAVDEEVGFVGE